MGRIHERPYPDLAPNSGSQNRAQVWIQHGSFIDWGCFIDQIWSCSNSLQCGALLDNHKRKGKKKKKEPQIKCGCDASDFLVSQVGYSLYVHGISSTKRGQDKETQLLHTSYPTTMTREAQISQPKRNTSEQQAINRGNAKT